METGSADDRGINETSSEGIVYDSQHAALFDIRVISPEMLDTVINEYGTKAVILKPDKGVTIGAISPGILYLRGDLEPEDYPLNDSVQDRTNEEIARHLIDIIFGSDTKNLQYFDDNKEYLIWYDKMYSQDDINFAREIITELNELSRIITFDDDDIALPSYMPNYNPASHNYYKISLFNRQMLDDAVDDRNATVDHLFKSGGNTIGMVTKDHLYLIADLKPEERRYYILKGLLYSMGFHGESDDETSFFSKKNTRNTNLSVMDQKAIRLVYGGRLSKGMDRAAIEKEFDINQDKKAGSKKLSGI